MLEILRRRRLAATFFVIGEKLRDPAARACSERAHSDGHWIGNHTWTHSAPLGDRPGPEIADREITRTQAGLGPLAHARRFFRPMGGGGQLGPHLLSTAAADLLLRDAYTCVLWNAVPRDWADPDGWIDTALRHVERQSWTVLVLHDLPTGAMAHLEHFLDRIEERGGQICQDFPVDCTPIVAGMPMQPLHRFTSP